MKLPKIEISLKFSGALKTELRTVRSTSEAAEVLRLLFNPNTIEYTEEVVMLCLNQNCKVIGFYRVSAGGMASSIVDIRVVATVALNCAAVQVILAHNHPTGNLKPSDHDINTTTRLRDGLKLLDIKLLDHIILSDVGHMSMTEEGYM